jgi:hypothetical protein
MMVVYKGKILNVPKDKNIKEVPTLSLNLSSSLKLKIKVSLCLTEHHVMKTCLLLNKSPCHEDVLREWRYRCVHFNPGTEWR